MPISPHTATREYFETDSEFKVFNLFNSLFGVKDDKWVFANVNYVDAGRKLNGQVDYIYLDNEIVLFFEVKGGNIQFDENTKKIIKNYDGRPKDPFKQVTDYLFDFRNNKIKDKFKESYFEQKLAFGYCVLLPDGLKPSNFVNDFNKGNGLWTIEYSPKYIGDFDDLYNLQNFTKFINNLKNIWKTHKCNSYHNGLTSDEVKQVSSFIREKLSFEIPLPKYLQINERETIYYTEQQSREILKLVSKNIQHGFIINGGPGTGKTLIARELLVKRKSLNEKVLFVCRNKSLADFLRNDIKDENSDLLIDTTIIHINGLFENTIKKNFKMDFDSLDETDLPEFLLNNKDLLEGIRTFDYLIIDEGQDLFFEKNIEVLEMFLKGGLESKHFCIFLDIDTQNSYGDYDSIYFNDFISKYNPLQTSLEKNCRNIRGIIETSYIYTGTKTCECMKTTNIVSKPIFWDSKNDLFNLIKFEIKKLLANNVPIRSISVLTSENLINEIVSLDLNIFKKWNKEEDFFFSKERIMVMTPEDFKGLENNIIIFTGTTSFNPQKSEDVALWHIAFTRAKDNLFLFFPKYQFKLISELYFQNRKI